MVLKMVIISENYENNNENYENMRIIICSHKEMSEMFVDRN